MKLDLKHLIELSNKDVENRQYPFFWEADDNKFNSMYLARLYEKQFKTKVRFVAKDFAKIKENLNDKKIDPDKNYNLEYVQKLRRDYSDVKIMFSGGYDSVTVFHHFVDNNIFIDETVTMMPLDIEPEISDEITYNINPLLKKYTKLVGKHSNIYNTYNDCKQFWQNHNVFLNTPYGDTMPPPVTNVPLTYFRPEYSKNTCYVKGVEQPHLIYYKNKWYVVALETMLGSHIGLSNAKYFWYDADNIKSLLQDSRKYRDYVCNFKEVKDNKLQFFKLSDDDEFNIINRHPIPAPEVKLKKADKDFIRRTRLILHERYDIMQEYCKCINTLTDFFPETSSGLQSFKNKNKFAWFIDIDSLEVFSQEELIPYGFEN